MSFFYKFRITQYLGDCIINVQFLSKKSERQSKIWLLMFGNASFKNTFFAISLFIFPKKSPMVTMHFVAVERLISKTIKKNFFEILLIKKKI